MANIVSDIKELKIQGARQIALESLKHLKKFAARNGFGAKFDHECSRLLAARPTAVVLYNVLKELDKDKTAKKIDFLIKALLGAEKKIADNCKAIFKKNMTVMTHCHSHEVVAALLASRKKISRVYVTETRPFYQGVMTARDLVGKIPTTLIVDSAAGFYMHDIDAVFVGCDALRKEGVVNKIGTMPLAMTAAEFGKPVYVIGSSWKLDKRASIKIEMRNPREVGRPIKGVEIKNPAFDVTPFKYIYSIVTEKGILKTKEILRDLR
ncbi:MAG: hypothetical protein HZB67_01920 [Candidatus Aenigmarchaeota archaeon]|nr:hypothetical protein [Candidatus Aenigmarchaeota archaeon]